jgi:putative phage-type endonuclease
MTARLVLPGIAPEAEWLEARRQGITASEIAVVMGLSPYSSPFALFHEKAGDLPGGLDDTLFLRIGRHNESLAADLFAEAHPEFRVSGDGRALFAHPERPWQLATPDRLVTEGSYSARDAIALLECKVYGSYDGWGDDGTDQIPVHYRCQVLWQMDVAGVSTGYVACLFFAGSRQFRVYELTMDDQAREDLGLMLGEAARFLARLVHKEPPDVDWRPATRDALKRLHPGLDEDREVLITHQLAGRYQGACRALKAAEQRKAKYENQIRVLLGTGNYVLDAMPPNVTIARRDVYDLPEKIITRKACTVDRLMPVKPKETSP